MDKMFVRVPVAVKAKVTEDLKLKIIGDVQETIKKMDLELEHFEFQAKKALAQAAGDLSVLPALRSQIDAERSKRQAAKAEAEARLKRAQDLEIGAEIGHGTLERTVEVTIGTDLDALARAEILTEDGKSSLRTVCGAIFVYCLKRNIRSSFLTWITCFWMTGARCI